MCVLIVIASLDGVRDGVEELSALDFSIFIIDEVHKVKNVKSGTAKAFRRFPTVLRYGLTGTAIQNKLEEFRAILE